MRSAHKEHGGCLVRAGSALAVERRLSKSRLPIQGGENPRRLLFFISRFGFVYAQHSCVYSRTCGDSPDFGGYCAGFGVTVRASLSKSLLNFRDDVGLRLCAGKRDNARAVYRCGHDTSVRIRRKQTRGKSQCE